MTTKVAVDVKTAAEMLSLGTRSVYRAIKAKQLPHLVFGKRIVIPVQALQAYARDAYKPDETDGQGREDVV